MRTTLVLDARVMALASARQGVVVAWRTTATDFSRYTTIDYAPRR